MNCLLEAENLIFLLPLLHKHTLVYKGSNETYDFRKFKTICVFGNEIRNNIINMSMADDEQDQLLKYINKLKSKTKPHI